MIKIFKKEIIYCVHILYNLGINNHPKKSNWRIFYKNMVTKNLHEQNSECRSSAPSMQWWILSQTNSWAIHWSFEHWKPLWQPYKVEFLKAVIIILKPFSSVPQESVLYFKVAKLLVVMITPFRPTVSPDFSQLMLSCVKL